MNTLATTWDKIGGDWTDSGFVYRVTPGSLTLGYFYAGSNAVTGVEVLAMPGPFQAVSALARANRESGHYYFVDDTTDFFGAEYYHVYGGRLLVDSIQPPRGAREYRVQCFGDDGAMLARFGRFATLNGAHNFAAALVMAATA